MKNANAAGRNTDPLADAITRQRAHMETQLELLTGVMRTSVMRADESTRENDEYGHARDSAVGQAVKIGDVSARILLALGKLSGEFHHNINVTKGTGNRHGACRRSGTGLARCLSRGLDQAGRADLIIASSAGCRAQAVARRTGGDRSRGSQGGGTGRREAACGRHTPTPLGNMRFEWDPKFAAESAAASPATAIA